MKIAGKSFSVPTEDVVFKRGEEFIPLKVQGILNMAEFEKIVQEPQPPVIRSPGKADRLDTTDVNFLAAVKDYGQYRQDYIMVKALEATPGLEWAKVQISDPTTWCNWRDELASIGLVHFEIEQVIAAIMRVNGLGQQMEEAKAAFLSAIAAQNRQATT